MSRVEMKLSHTRLLLALLGLLMFGFLANTHADSRNWSLVDTEGQTFSYDKVKADAPTMLVFWATWCAPCKKELSENQKLLDSFADQGLRVLLVAEDNAKTQAKVKPYVSAKGFKWQVLLDTDGEVLKRYGGTSLPYSVLLDKTGKAVRQFRGEIRDKSALTTQVNALLGGNGE
jgi:cytochrome c biogenesis protein CcmG/thiol:disulfide interchange protein DsbE